MFYSTFARSEVARRGPPTPSLPFCSKCVQNTCKTHTHEHQEATQSKVKRAATQRPRGKARERKRARSSRAPPTARPPAARGNATHASGQWPACNGHARDVAAPHAPGRLRCWERRRRVKPRVPRRPGGGATAFVADRAPCPRATLPCLGVVRPLVPRRLPALEVSSLLSVCSPLPLPAPLPSIA